MLHYMCRMWQRIALFRTWCGCDREQIDLSCRLPSCVSRVVRTTRKSSLLWAFDPLKLKPDAHQRLPSFHLNWKKCKYQSFYYSFRKHDVQEEEETATLCCFECASWNRVLPWKCSYRPYRRSILSCFKIQRWRAVNNLDRCPTGVQGKIKFVFI